MAYRNFQFLGQFFLFFLMYTNDLDHAIKFCKAHHFADDTDVILVNQQTNLISISVLT